MSGIRETKLNITKYCPVSWDLNGTTEENCKQLIRTIFEEASNSRINLWDAYVHAWDSKLRTNNKEWFEREETEVNGRKVKHKDMAKINEDFKALYEQKFKVECKGDIFNLLRLMSKVRNWRFWFGRKLLVGCNGIKEQNSQIKIPTAKRDLAIQLASKALEEFKEIKNKYDVWDVFNHSKPDIYIRQFDISDAYTREQEARRTQEKLLEQILKIREDISKKVEGGKQPKGKAYIRRIERIKGLLDDWGADEDAKIREELNTVEGMLS